MLCSFIISLCVLFCWMPMAYAGTTDVSPTPGFMLAESGEISKDLSIFTDMSYVNSAQFSGGLGSVSVLRSDIGMDYSIFRLTYGRSDFFWEDKRGVSFSAGDSVPWETLHDVTLQARLLNDTLDENWHYWLNGELSSSFESDFPGAVGAGFDGGVAYDFWDGWLIGITGKTIALSALSTDLFGEAALGLTIAVSQKTLRDTLKAIGLYKESPEGSENIGFSVAFSGSEKTYRLSSSSPVRKNGYLGLTRSKVGAYIDYSPNESLKLVIGPEYNYTRKYRLYDSTGKLTSSHRLKDAFGGYARLSWAF